MFVRKREKWSSAMNEIDQFVHLMISNGISWASTQRDTHRPNAHALRDEDREAMKSFFSPETLDEVRLHFVPIIENPDFFAEFEMAGQPISLDFRMMQGITFVDTILISKEMRDPAEGRWLPLLFHELVHVVQYKVLGLEEFMRRYVTGWAENGRQYAKIPLEVQAYTLQEHFETAPGLPFDIEDRVRKELGVGAP